jgi:hypothetical protein
MSRMSRIQQSIIANPRGTMAPGSPETTLHNYHVEIDRKIGVGNIRPALREPAVLHSSRVEWSANLSLARIAAIFEKA